jgi:ketosteroid isomerase-like protein
MSQASPEEASRDLIYRYLQAIERGDDVSLEYLHPDIHQQEFPNRIVPNGIERDLDGIRLAAERGRQVIQEQRYEVRSLIATADQVAVEVLWTGVLKIPLGTLAAGAEMRAYSAMFFQLRDGKIVDQRNYDCFEPW